MEVDLLDAFVLDFEWMCNLNQLNIWDFLLLVGLRECLGLGCS